MAVASMEILKQDTESIVISMGEVAVSAVPSVVLTCIGLGSCIAVCAYDHVAKIGGMVHVVLPEHRGDNPSDFGKFADTGVPLMLAKVIKSGGDKKHLIVKAAGGAQMTISPGSKDTFRTGERNLAQVLATLEKLGIGLVASDVGGSMGRTIKLHVGTGKVTVKTVNGVPKEL